MNLPKFEPGQRVCILDKNEHIREVISSMVVEAVWYDEKFGNWWYELSQASADGFLLRDVPERDVLTFTEAFGEYYEKANYKRNI